MFNIAEAMEAIPKLQKIAESYNQNLEVMKDSIKELQLSVDELNNKFDEILKTTRILEN